LLTRPVEQAIAYLLYRKEGSDEYYGSACFPEEEEKLKAYAAMTFDDVFVVHNLRIVKGEKG